MFNDYKLAEIYAAVADGYIRQSVVRVADQFIPGVVAAVALDNENQPIGADEAEVRDQTDALCRFLLEAVMDDDGRVRQSAKRAREDVFRTYDSFGDEKTVEALALELESMVDEHSGKLHEHLLEAKEDAYSYPSLHSSGLS